MDDRNQFGKLAQATFVQRALAQGLQVAEPFGNDNPFDYVVGAGKRFRRVQIKGSRASLYNRTFQVSIGHHTGFAAARRAVPYTAEEIDLVAAWLVEEDSWYLIPIEIVDGRVGLSFHARNHPRFGRWRPYLENWDLLRQMGEGIVLPADEPNAASPRRTKGMRGAGRREREEGFLEPLVVSATSHLTLAECATVAHPVDTPLTCSVREE